MCETTTAADLSMRLIDNELQTYTALIQAGYLYKKHVFLSNFMSGGMHAPLNDSAAAQPFRLSDRPHRPFRPYLTSTTQSKLPPLNEGAAKSLAGANLTLWSLVRI